MAEVKVTVVKRTVNEDLATEYAQPGTGICTDGIRPVIFKVERIED